MKELHLTKKPEAQLADLPPYEGPQRPRLRFLGTGTSAGVPILGCRCPVCNSQDPRDKRFRTSALLETRNARILIDAGPDLRQQLLPLPFYPLDGILLTHRHYDHMAGLDDLRGFCIFGDQHIYTEHDTAVAVHEMFPYCFADHLYPGVPLLKLHEIEPHKPFYIEDVCIMPLRVMHDQMPILGFRIGDLAYITDMKTIGDEELPYLEGVTTLVVNALRWERPHHSHALVSDALEFIAKVRPQVSYLVHVTHHIGLQDEAESRLPDNVHLAYDGLEITI